MKALSDARIEDLGLGDFVRVQCAVCAHDELLPALSFPQGSRLPPHTRIVDLDLGTSNRMSYAPSSSVVICLLQLRSDHKRCDRLTMQGENMLVTLATHAIRNLANGDRRKLSSGLANCEPGPE